MKKNYFSFLGLFLLSFLSIAQTTEVFEDESSNSNSFTDNSVLFNITSSTPDVFDVLSLSGAGWNGSSTDNKFIDNTGIGENTNDGTNFSIKRNDLVDFTVLELYLFVSTKSLTAHSGTVTITGKNSGGSTVFTFTKSSGFSNPVTFSPNNGFTKFDFVTDGASDFSMTPINELLISSTSNADYLALDAFKWNEPILSLKNGVSNNFKIFPNPIKNEININATNVKTAWLFSIDGKLLKQVNSNQINTQKLPSGIYILKVQTDEGIVVKKIIKE